MGEVIPNITMVLLTPWVVLISLFHGTLGHFWDEDTDRDEWIYSLQESIFDIDELQDGVKLGWLDHLGYIGSAIVEVWIDQHCSINSEEEGQTTQECHQCIMPGKNIFCLGQNQICPRQIHFVHDKIFFVWHKSFVHGFKQVSSQQ